MLLPVKPLKDKQVEAIPLSVLPKNTRTYRPISTLALLNAECRAGKLWTPTFKVFWSDSARESNPGLPTTRRTL